MINYLPGPLAFSRSQLDNEGITPTGLPHFLLCSSVTFSGTGLSPALWVYELVCHSQPQKSHLCEWRNWTWEHWLPKRHRPGVGVDCMWANDWLSKKRPWFVASPPFRVTTWVTHTVLEELHSSVPFCSISTRKTEGMAAWDPGNSQRGIIARKI